MNNVMLDLETLGINPKAPIAAIGAVYFDETGLGDRFYRMVDLACYDDYDPDIFTLDYRTLKWWFEQSDAAIKSTFCNGRLFSLRDALSDFAEFLKPAREPCVWGNGSDFDNVVLKDKYVALRSEIPWSHRGDRCYRTLKALHQDVVREDIDGITHNALDDAVNQAIHASKILRTFFDQREKAAMYDELGK